MSDVFDTTQDLPVLYEDNSLIAVHKPTGLFVHRSEADRSETNFVLQIVRDMVGGFVYPVHRLDRATSGIVLMAKSSEVAALLSQMFANRAISKTYMALVRGYSEAAGEIDTPLISARGRDKPDGHPFREPQDAITVFAREQRYEIPLVSDRYPTTRCSLVRIQPATGRYHQIRRHFNYVSHPVIGDSSHGDTRQNRFFASQCGCQRLMLAAVHVAFQHPVTEEFVDIHCAPDSSFSTVLQRLEPWRCRSNGAQGC